MPRVKRTPVATTDDWQQLELLVRSPEQRVYELIRPIVLFGCPPAARARETGAPQRTLYRQADAFARDGMASLFPPPRPAKHHALPEELRRAIRALKAEHPPLNLREIATICDLRFGRSLSHHTVKRILAEAPVAPAATRRFPPYQQSADPVERRLAIIRLHSEGWNKQSIADYLQCSRVTVHETLKRWAAEGVAGLDDKSHARKDGPRKVDMAVMAHVRDLAQNPELGAFRLYAALTQLGIHVSVRTCGRLLARNRALYGPVARRPEPKVPKPMPFAARRRHQIWSVDIRYLTNDTLEGRAYSSAILDNYSRALVASALSPRQDLTAFLIVLYAAIRQHGAPEVLVSDSGSVFRAKQAQAISRALGIDKREIARKQPWPGAPWAHMSRRCSPSSAAWPIGISRGRWGGMPWRMNTRAGRRTTTPRSTSPTSTGPKPGAAPPPCSVSCRGGMWRRRSCIGSSTAHASGGWRTGWGTCASATGGCTGNAASLAKRSRCGCTTRP